MSLCFESCSAQSFLLKSHGDLAASQLWMTNHRGLVNFNLVGMWNERRALDGANLCQESQSNHCDVFFHMIFDQSHKFVQGKEEPRETVFTGGLTWNVIGHIHTHQLDMVYRGLKLASKQGGWLTGLAVSQETKNETQRAWVGFRMQLRADRVTKGLRQCTAFGEPTSQDHLFVQCPWKQENPILIFKQFIQIDKLATM